MNPDGLTERRQICICRVICIFFMMSVHVSPGLRTASAVTVGDFALFGEIWGNLLGRASVATLSFISGYLLWRAQKSKSIGAVARGKFRTLVLPMLTWNLIFLVLLLGGAAVSGTSVPTDRAAFGSFGDAFAAFTGLTGPTANESLFFLRDLFVASVIVRLALPWLLRAPVLLLVLLVVITLFDLIEPVVFRPSILFFVAAGVVAAQRVDTLAVLCRARVLVPAGVAAVAVLLGLRVVPVDLGAPGAEATNLVRRALLVMMVLPMSLALAATRFGLALVWLEMRIFETYLLHVPLLSALWVVWVSTVGGAERNSYVIFFVLAPFAALIAAQVFGAVVDRLPAWIQLALRGKRRFPAPIPARQPVPGA